MIPVHVGGLMMNVDDINAFASRHGLWVVEDAAHAFPGGVAAVAGRAVAAVRPADRRVSCFSFYANKTITTGEGGMAVTDDAELAARMRLMSLHGLSHDAWGRYSGNGSWDYRILAPGYKYNLTDIAAAIGDPPARPRRGDAPGRAKRSRCEYLERLSDVDELELPPTDADRIHAWHLFPIRLRLDALAIDRNQFMQELNQAGVACSVHWRPLHLHPYYEQTFGWRAGRSAGRVRRCGRAWSACRSSRPCAARRSTPS